MTDLNTTKAKIEQLVLNKKSSLATVQIQKFYREFGHKSETLFICCDWYRRLGLYQKAIVLLKINSDNLKIAHTTATLEGRKILWFSRMQNLLGAPTIAQRLIANITPATIEDHRIFGLIHLTNFSYQKAYESFLKVVGDNPAVKTYQNRIDVLNLTDSMVGIKKLPRALELNNQILAQSESDYETALMNNAVGETYCAMESWDLALEHLKKSEEFYTKKSTSIDLAFLQKWIGLCYYRLGNTDQCRLYSKKSVASLIKLSAKEDALLLSLDFAAQFKLLSPVQSLRLQLIKNTFYGHDLILTAMDQIGLSSSSIKINWRSKEVAIKSKTGTSFQFEFNKEIFLIIVLKLFEDWGINYYRVYDLIYTEDPFSIVSAKDRIKALIQRLKKVYGLKVTIKGDRLFLSKDSAKKILIKNLDSIPFYDFLKNHVGIKRFKTKDVMTHYLVSRPMALALIQQWKALNLVANDQDDNTLILRIPN